MAAGSRLSWHIMDFFSCLKLFKYRPSALVLVQGECDKCRPLMLESYPWKSICDVVRQLFVLLVQDVCCEVFVHTICPEL